MKFQVNHEAQRPIQAPKHGEHIQVNITTKVNSQSYPARNIQRA